MKRFLALIPLIFLFVSCDNIDEDDRYIEIDPIESQRRVLLEEFTGQRCTNCPAAHAVIEKLQEQYGDELIVVSIHAGSFGIAAPYGLMQPEGDEYASHWGISAYPAGVVDRTGDVLTSDAWAAAIRNEAEKITDLVITLNAKVSDDGSKIDVTTEMLTSTSLTGHLQLWIVEDGIIGFQIDGSQRLQDYEHNNVFRACVNGLWGQQVSLSPNYYHTAENSINIDETWNVDNLSVVGFVYNDSGVIQVNKCKVETNQ